MSARIIAACVAGISLLLLTAATGAAAGSPSPPDPAPLGPQRPAEPEVEGPVNLDRLKVSVNRTGTPRGVRVTFDRHSRTADGGIPAGARRFVFLFDSTLRFNPTAFPVCSRQTIDTEGVAACPPGSRVGSAVGTYLDGSQVEAVAVNSQVAGGPGVLLAFPATGLVLEQTLERATIPYQREYTWAIDELLPPNETPPQNRPGTTRFVITFGATTTAGGRPVSYVETADPHGPYSFGLWSEFVTGQVALPTDHALPRPR